MATAQLSEIRTFTQLIKYLKDELDWPISTDDFEELTYSYTAEELGIDEKSAARIEQIKRLKPLDINQPWGVFFVKFEPKGLPVVALRRILGSVVVKKRASANKSEQAAWNAEDLLFISNYGQGDTRQISFAHFSEDPEKKDLPTLKVLGWDQLDTALHIGDVADTLREHLSWPDDPSDKDSWRKTWRSAFTLRHKEVITTSKALAIRLAQLARAIRERIQGVIEVESDRGPVTKLMDAFQEALIHDLKPESFADMYAQTIAYGLLSARVTHPEANTADGFASQLPVTNPFLKELMETFLNVGGRRKGAGIDFDELGVNEVVELLDHSNMEAVIRDFGDRNPQEDPVIHFYELFMNEYAPSERVRRGIFYTPRPVVSFIVRSVHELLQTEFELEDGLADTATWGEMAARCKDLELPQDAEAADRFVNILDPATGTGTFLVEAIDVIYRTLLEKWKAEGQGEKEISELWNAYVPTHLLPRLHGYELLMAPYAIAHMKVGLKLQETGYRFASRERVKVFLTNALESQSSTQQVLDILPALAHEADAVNSVKKHQVFTVAFGNPPYAGHSSNNQIPWIVGKVHDYTRDYPDLQRPGQAKWLQDDYVKFLRLVEMHIERAGVGVVGFITNHSWLENPTFKGMRSHFLKSFSRAFVLDLHGNANRKEVTEEGAPDENVFAIRQGVAISLLLRDSREPSSSIQRSDMLGPASIKLSSLLKHSISSVPKEQVLVLEPTYVFSRRDQAIKTEYQRFLDLPSIFDQNGPAAPGIVTTHDEFAISFTADEQAEKVKSLLSSPTEEAARELFKLCSQNQWNYDTAKAELSKSDWAKNIKRILYRPFDVRFTVYDRHVAVHRRERVSQHMLSEQNIAISVPRATEIKRGWEHVFCSRFITQHHTVSLKEVNYLFPLWLDVEWPGAGRTPNISPSSVRTLGEAIGSTWSSELDGPPTSDTEFGPRDVFDYVYAILHAPSYRGRYSEMLKDDFARVPLTPSRELFLDLKWAGNQLVEMHLMDSLRPEDWLDRYIGPSNPAVGLVGWSDETVWLDAGKTDGRNGHIATSGGTVGFKGVTRDVWDFHIGGYRICHKWLKDRRGRNLTNEDIESYQKIVVAISETIRLMNEIDEVIEERGGWPDAFQLM